MLKRWAGPLITAGIVGGVALIVVLNLDLKGPPPSASEAPESAPVADPPRGFREYPIGTPQERVGMKIAAVWLPPVRMEGMTEMPGSGVIHLEADIHATEGNPNGFAKDEFVPYLKVAYRVIPAKGGATVQGGEMVPMVARDGLHYGASIALPEPGTYRLTYDIEPPSAGGLGRHSDSATGVAPWWKPFQVTFDWDYPGPPK